MPVLASQPQWLPSGPKKRMQTQAKAVRGAGVALRGSQPILAAHTVVNCALLCTHQ